MKLRTKCKLILLMVLVVCIFTACNKKDTTIGETSKIFDGFIISDSVVLQKPTSYIHIYDFETGKNQYLCNIPNCSHSTVDCTARTDLMYPFYFDNNLYLFGSEDGENYTLYQCNRYGENRRAWIENLEGYPRPDVMVIFEETLYYGASCWDKEKEEDYGVIYSVNLNNKEVQRYYIENHKEALSKVLVNNQSIFYTTGSTNLNLNEYIDFETGNISDIPWDELVTYTNYYQIDKSTGETKLLKCVESTSNNVVSGLISVDEDNLFYYLKDGIYEYCLDSGISNQIFAYTGEQIIDSIKMIDHMFLLELYDENNFLDKTFALIDNGRVVLEVENDNLSSYLGQIGERLFFHGINGLYMISYDDFINKRDNFMWLVDFVY